MMKRLISILLVFLVLFSSLLSVNVVLAEEDDFDTDQEEISEVTDDTSDEEDISAVDVEKVPEENIASETEYEDVDYDFESTSLSEASEITPYSGTAYAVLTDDGDLIFFRSFETYAESEQKQNVVDIYSNKYSGIVFTDVENTGTGGDKPVPWSNCPEPIVHAYVAPGQTITPLSMEDWFWGNGSLISFDGTGFDTSRCVSMLCTFQSYNLETVDLKTFDTSNLRYMSAMFLGSKIRHLDLSSFDTSNVENMNEVFMCESLVSITLGPKWTVWKESSPLPEGTWINRELGISKTETELQQEYPSHASEWAGTWTKDLSREGTAYAVLTDDGDLIFFRSYEAYESSVVSTVKDVYGNEYKGIVYAEIENTQYGSWSKEKELIRTVSIAGDQIIQPISMSGWFNDCTELMEFSSVGFDTSKVSSMGGMFSGCSSLASLDVSHFDTSNVTDMKEMFMQCSSLESLDVSSFDTSNVTDMSHMFYGCSSLTSLDVSHFDTSNVIFMIDMFSCCSSLASLDVSHFDTSNVKDMSSMFYGCSSLTSLDVSHFDTSNAGMISMFSYCSSLTSLDVSHFDTSNETDMRNMFSNCSSLTSLDVSHFDTSNVTDMGGIFSGCSSLTSLDVSRFDTSNVTDMRDMFSRCSSLASLDVSRFDTSNVTDMKWMFYGCSSLTSLDVSHFDTSNVTDMKWMFMQCSSLESLDVSSFDTSNVTDMSNMFSGCLSLESLDVSHFDTSNVTNFGGMFDRCTSLLSLDLSSFNTENAIYMIRMFADCSSLTDLDLSNFITSNVISMREMFSFMNSEPSSFTSLDLSNFDTSSLQDIGYMFYGFSSLESLDLSSFDTNKVYYDVDMEQPAIERMYGMTETFAGCDKLNSIVLGPVWTKWINEAYLPEGTWSNKELGIFKTETELYEQYPTNAKDWAGEWTRNIPVSRIELDRSEVILNEGETAQLNVTVLPENATIKDLSWSSSDEEVANVDENGLVTAINEGEAIITVSSMDGSLLNAQCTVMVFGDNYYGDILPEDRPDISEQIPTGLWTSRFIDYVYIGKAITQDFRVYDYKTLLTEGTDYTVKYMNNTKAGTATITITGKGNYTGTLSKTFEILPYELNADNCKAILNRDVFIESGKIQKPTVSVESNGTKLKANTDYKVSYSNINSIQAGTYTLTVNGKGNYSGSFDASYTILSREEEKKPVSSLTISGIKDRTYDGSFIFQSITVKDGKNVLTENTDYTIRYENNVNAGKAYVYIEGIGIYSGTIIKSFKIKPSSLTGKNTEVSGLPVSVVYDGVHEPEAVLVHSGKTLIKDQDYSVTYKNNSKAGTATVTFKGIGNYSGSFSKTFKITRKEIPVGSIRLEGTYIYAKGGTKPVPEITVDGRRLEAGKDFTLTYKNNTSVNDGSGEKIPSVTIAGKGNYLGKTTLYFAIDPSDISALTFTIPDKAYSKTAGSWKSTPVLTDINGKKLVSGTDYEKTIIYKLNGRELTKNDVVSDGSVIDVTVIGKDNYEGTIQGSYRIVTYDLSKATVTIPNQYYTGKPVTLTEEEITVKIGKTLIDPSNYRIVEGSYVNNTAKGTAKVTIQGIGNYGGTKTVSFKIVQRSLGIVIHFDGNGATSGTMKDQIVYKNNVSLSKNAFKRTVNGVSVKFLGWNTKPDGSGTQYDSKYTDYSIFKAGQYVTLYAIWEGGSSPEDPTGKPLRILQLVSATLGGYSCEDMVYEGIQRFCRETDSSVDTFELNYDDTHTDSSLDELCSSGRYDVVVTGYWSMEEYVERAALKYPDIRFLVFDCTVDFDRYPQLKKNVATYLCRQNTLAFSAGALAALITESGKGLANKDKTIGFVGGGMITAIDDFLIGYIQGAHYIDPQIRVFYSYVGNWEDSDKAYEFAHSMYLNGSDICFAVCAPASFGVCQQAYDDNVYALGVDTDHSGQLSISHPEQAANTVSSAVKQFGYAIYDALVSVYDGSIRFGVNNVFGFESGYLQMIENDVFNSVFKEGMPEEYAAYQSVVQKLLNGEIDVGTAIGATQEYIENEKRKADPNP